MDPHRECASGCLSLLWVSPFDLQSVFSTPRLSSNVVYYKRQLSVYNLGIHDCSNETAHMHVWDETIASRGAQEIASCLRKYLASNGHQGSKTYLILWSDSCGGQNRNIKVALRLLELVQDPSVSYNIITQKFLESGHSFLPNDSDFGDIEKRLKHHSEVYVPQQYYDVIREARSSSKPFKVIEMTQDDFFSTAMLEKATVNNNNNNNNPICKAPECQKTSVALVDRNSRAN